MVSSRALSTSGWCALRRAAAGLWQPEAPAREAPEQRVPRQLDYAERLAQVTVRPPEPLGQAPRVPRVLLEDSRATWLARDPFRLVLGAGLMGIHEHLGRIQALAAMRIVPDNIVGVSSGAVLGSLVCAMPLRERALQSRLPTGSYDQAPDGFTSLLRRPEPIYAISDDPAHLTLLVDIDRRLVAPGFIWQLDTDRARQRQLIDLSREATLAWLCAPCSAAAVDRRPPAPR